MTALCSKKRRGFNLIEAAIVLGVVGLVVAGVWVAAAAISERREVNNVKDFILYGQGLSLKYSQAYPITTYLSLRNVMADDMPLPGGFRLHHYSPTSRLPLSENNKVAIYLFYNKFLSFGGYILNDTYSPSVVFLENALVLPWTFTPRPSICVGIISWLMGVARSRRVVLGYSDIDISGAGELFWDSESGSAPPNANIICKTAIFLDMYMF